MTRTENEGATSARPRLTVAAGPVDTWTVWLEADGTYSLRDGRNFWAGFTTLRDAVAMIGTASPIPEYDDDEE